MQIGPIQLIVVGFESNDRFRGQIMRELEALRGRGLMRVLDLLFVMKDKAGNITAFEQSDLTPEEELEWGAVISRMMGLDGDGPGREGELSPEALAAAEHDYGLTAEDIIQIAEQIEPGTSAGILLFEHTWAIGLKAAIHEAGGHLLAQGVLTPEALWMVGEEIRTIAEAQETIELAEAVKGAAMLDALATVVAAEAIEEEALAEAAEAVVAADMIKTAAAAEAIRALIVAGMIEEAAALEAIDTLHAAGLLEAAAIQEAEDVVAQAEAVAAAALAEVAQSSNGDDAVVGEPSE